MKRAPSHKSGPSQRQLRVGEQIRHMIVETLQFGTFHDERLMDDAMGVTVSEVRCSPDLKNATAYVMTLGGKNLEETLEALNDAAPFFQKEINRKATLKFTPRVTFKRDKSFDEAQKIESIIKNLPPAADDNDEE